MNAKDLLVYQALVGETSGSSEPSVTVEPLEVTENGEFTAPEGKAYSPVTVNVPSGGGGVSEDDDVLFIDYDGTVVHSYSASDFLALTEMPENPSHTGLVAQGWNWNLADAQAYVQYCGMQVIGQMYSTESGATEIDIVTTDGTKEVYLGIAPNGIVEIDWGDGTYDVAEGSSLTTIVSTPHTYADAGDYTIKLTTGAEVFSFAILGSSGNSSLLTNGTSVANSSNYALRNSIMAVRLGVNATLGNYAFANCGQLRSVILGESVANIPQGCFSNSGLKSIVLIPGVEEIKTEAFRGCNSLSLVAFSASGINIAGTAFQQAGLVRCALGVATLSGNQVFGSNSRLKRVSVFVVDGSGTNAYSYSTSVESVSISPYQKVVLDDMFSSLQRLVAVDIPDGVERIGARAFYGCYSLATIHIGKDVEVIGDSAFYNAFSAGAIYVDALEPPAITSGTFGGISSGCVFYVPNAALSAYQSAANWSTYASQMVGV